MIQADDRPLWVIGRQEFKFLADQEFLVYIPAIADLTEYVRTHPEIEFVTVVTPNA